LYTQQSETFNVSPFLSSLFSSFFNRLNINDEEITMNVVGFDVGKAHLFAARLDRSGIIKEHWELLNTRAALLPVLQSLRKQYRHLVIASEATGDFHRLLALTCLELDIPFRLLNPLLTKQFTRATVRKKKTDKTDAEVIARLALQGQGHLATKATFTELKPIFRTSVKLVEMSQMVMLLEQHVTCVMPKGSVLQEQLRSCHEQLLSAANACKQELADRCDSELQNILTSMPGVGVTIATSLIAEIGDITRFKDSKALVAYAGLDPRKFQSGSTLNRSGHINKRGSPHLRRSLYLAATIAKRHDPRFHALYEKKRAEGKRYREAIIIVARAILRCIYVMWTKNKMYELRCLT
jgi:transposase